MGVNILSRNKRNISNQDVVVYLLLFAGFTYFFALSIYAGFSFDERNVFSITINNSDGILTPFNLWMHRPIGYKIYIYILSLIPKVHHYYYLNDPIFVYLLLIGHNMIRLVGAYLFTKAFISNSTPYKQEVVFFTIYAITASLVAWDVSLNAEDAAINIMMLSTGLLLRKSRVSVFIGAVLMAALPYFKGITAIYAVPAFMLIFLYKRELFFRLIVVCGTMFGILTFLLVFFTLEFKELFEMATYEGARTISIFDRLKMIFYHQHEWIVWIPPTALMLLLGYSLFCKVYENKEEKNRYVMLLAIITSLSLPVLEVFIQGKPWMHNGVSAAAVAIAFVIIASKFYKSHMFMIIACLFMALQTTCISLHLHHYSENGFFLRDLQKMNNNAEKVIEADEPVLNLSVSILYIAALQVKRPSASRYAINVPFDRLNWKDVDIEKLKETSGYKYTYEYVNNFDGNFMAMTEISRNDIDTLNLVESKIKSDYSRYFYVDQGCTEWKCLKIFIRNSYNKPIPNDVKVHIFSE